MPLYWQVNTLNEAYVKARYSKGRDIGEDALAWPGERISELPNFSGRFPGRLAKSKQASKP